MVVHVDDQTAGPSHLCDDTLTDVNNNSTPKVYNIYIYDLLLLTKQIFNKDFCNFAHAFNLILVT